MGLFFNNQDIANAGITEKAVLYSRSRFSWGLSEIRAAKPDGARLLREAPAAFRRLCVETNSIKAKLLHRNSPAAFRRLCVETLEGTDAFGRPSGQPPSGGCVLKHLSRSVWRYRFYQPPSGGCVLKLLLHWTPLIIFPSRLQAAVC